MKIHKIINNGLVKIIDENGNECIAMGKGIGFNRKKGDEIKEEEIEKIYRISSSEIEKQFSDLISNIPLKHLKVANMIVDYASNALGKKLREGIYLSLTDHIDFALKRFEKGMHIKNRLLFEIKNYYPSEYRIGLEALKIVERELGIRLPEDEAGYIAIHIAQFSAETENSDFTDQSMKIIHMILNIIRYTYSLELNVDSLSYERLLVHLKYFSARIINHTVYEKSDKLFIERMKEYFKSEFQCCLKIKKIIKTEFDYEMDDDEMLYLCIHIRRVLTDR